MVEIVLLVISAIVGAGFATGAELITFFGDTGLHPVVISAMVAVFSVIIMAVLLYARKRPTKSTRYLFTTIYLAVFIVMTAGLKSLSGTLATVLALGFCCLVVFWGLGGVLRVNKYLMYFVLAILVFTCVTSLFKPSIPTDVCTRPNIIMGVGKALLYSGLNCCILERVFLELRERNSARRVFMACVWAMIVIACMVTLILSAINHLSVRAEMPILELSNNIITKTAVFFCILTSMMICLYTIACDLANQPKARVSWSVLFCCAAFGFSFLGFKSILGIVYPAIGVFMLLYVCGLGLGNLFFVYNSVNRLKVVSDK